jgi:Glycosyl hydrolases family 32 N-terminal domain/FlgD Ig-like domain
MIPSAPYWPKDFSLIKKDGVYHLFYIRRNVNLPTDQTQKDFGHAISTDLLHWTQAAPVIPVNPDGWDNAHVWAPSIVLKDSVYWMFYAGVSNVPGQYNSYQRIGVATSTDLYTWNRYDAPIFSCDQVPWTYCDSLDALTGFRDPFVMADPTTPGRWLMYYTTSQASDPSNMVVGLATSNGDFTQWTDLKPLPITYRPNSGSGTAESASLMEHDGLWYLFYTANGTAPIAFATSPDPTADLSGWTARGRLGDMLGFYTGSWFASEFLQDGLNDYLSYVNGDRIEIYRMQWLATAQFQLYQPDAFHVMQMQWNADTAYVNHAVNLSFASVNWFNRMAPIETLLLDSLGTATPVPPESLGIPSTVPMFYDTTLFSWTPRLWPAGNPGPMRVIVRMQDQTAQTPRPLIVLPDTAAIVPPDSFAVTRLAWTVDTTHTGQVALLDVFAKFGAGRSISLDLLTRDSTGTLQGAPRDYFSLADTLVLQGDTTTVAVLARTWPVDEGVPGITRLAAQLSGSTLTTDMDLFVLPDSLAPPDTFSVSRVFWGADSVGRGVVVPLRIVAHAWAGHSVTLAAFTADSIGALTAAPLDSLLLPATLALSADTTGVPWTSRSWPDSIVAHALTRVVVEICNGKFKTSPALIVRGDTIAAPPPHIVYGPGPPQGEEGILLKRMSATPLGGNMAFLVQLPSPMNARLEIFDLQGRRVASLANREMPRGASVIGWPGRGDDGRTMQAGVYFARLVTPRMTRVVRTVVLP